MIGWLVALLLFAIAFFNFTLLKGWLHVHPLDMEYSQAWLQKHRHTTRLTALVTSGSGLMCVLDALEIVKLFAAAP
ncbi:hypothetical protein [Prosthecobacter sp.]|uniref:hypothetical protein n=1 Tax=Prosthecobacter sp. TaxID=1965333 RepID=UPI003784B865